MAAPAPQTTQPRSVLRMLSDARDERALDGELPPGMTDFNVARTVAFAQNPLPILMEGYRTYGPVFTIASCTSRSSSCSGRRPTTMSRCPTRRTSSGGPAPSAT